MRRDRTLIAMMAVCLALFIAGTLFDEPVEWFMVEHGSSFVSAVAAAIGPLPPYVMLSMCFAYLSRKNRFLEIGSLVFAFVSGWSLFHRFVDGIGLLVSVFVTGIAIYGLMKWLVSRMESSDENRKKIITSIVVIVIARVIVEVMKIVFARPRFVYLCELDASYTPWFRAGGPVLSDDRFKSFPSGHAMSAALLYMWTMWKDGRKWKGIAICFALFVSLGRMMCGMHYLTDVAMGMFVGYGSLYLMKSMLE